jgi:hypothetical protein
MVEVIEIVSGAITFATVVAQITESIIAINDYCGQIKDAPHDLQILLNELELFGFILADIEEDLARDDVASALVNSKHATKSLNLCKQAAGDLESTAKGLPRDIMSSGRMKKSYAAVKNVLQRGKGRETQAEASRRSSITAIVAKMLHKVCFQFMLSIHIVGFCI